MSKKTDPYFYPGTEVLINKAGLKSQSELDKVEADFSSMRIEQIMRSGFNQFDIEGLFQIHKAIFTDIYDWAGELRTIDIIKSENVLGGLSIDYSKSGQIQDDLQRAISVLHDVKWRNLTTEETAAHFSKSLAELWRVHPFREGNTRSTITFMCLFARNKEIQIDSDLFAKNSGYMRNALVAASAIFEDLGDKRNFSYLNKIVLDALQRGREKPSLDQRLANLKNKNSIRPIPKKKGIEMELE